ncbi:IspD/TarI family cytidylyltransferase [Schinkia azotoformans]|uniref:IspD/TarI family cytidylyltransferase n=1 Tax=Schinkia azotoformans TaxID=1454 RepID=UPI002DB73E3C|nr:IspD/TarI family cytidylyltransferase [Schinkia azotoformans]MEC1714852.1 IspD/TarI family cytidylyltransferase [Schinkia azotoformans]
MNTALIFAGGTGTRMNSKSKPKQFLELNGKPIIIHTIDNFENHPEIDNIAVVCISEWIDYLKELLKKYYIKKVKWIVPGGETGQESRFSGLKAIYDESNNPLETIVLLHDGVRPLINNKLISDNINTVKQYGSAVTVTSAIETIINIGEKQQITDIIDRSKCKLARAPQSFYLEEIYNLHVKANQDGLYDVIDCATLMRHYGRLLYTVDGPVENIKITTPSDYYLFRALFEARENSQIWGI